MEWTCGRYCDFSVNTTKKMKQFVLNQDQTVALTLISLNCKNVSLIFHDTAVQTYSD